MSEQWGIHKCTKCGKEVNFITGRWTECQWCGGQLLPLARNEPSIPLTQEQIRQREIDESVETLERWGCLTLIVIGLLLIYFLWG